MLGYLPKEMAVFTVLNQLKIGPAVVQIAYIALIGSVAFGAALAFGLGGRDVADQLTAMSRTARPLAAHNRDQ